MILAIDLGSTSFKAAVFDRRLRMIASGVGRLHGRFGAGGQVELGIEAVQAALRDALKSAQARKHAITVISITSQAQTFTCVDEKGRPQLPFVSWQDTRSTDACAALKQELRAFGDHCSFGEPLPGLQLCHLRRIRPSARLMPLLLPSYVLRLWTGESVTDANIAAMSGLYSLSLRGWWPAALRACRLRESQLPRVIPVGAIAAMTTAVARRFGLPAGVPVVLAGNDQTAGGYAAGLERKRSLLITLGTAQVAYASRPTMPQPRAGVIRGPYPGGLFYAMAADSCGGNIVNWAKTVIAGCETDAAFFREAGRAPKGCHNLIFEASLDTGAGSWQNLGLHHTPADLARSVLESLAARLAGLVRTLGTSAKGQTILVAGGGSVQPIWRRIVAESLETKLTVTAASPLLGAARMAVRHGFEEIPA